MQLAQRLVRRGVLKPDDLARVAEAQAQSPSRPLHELLVERNFAKEEEVLAVLAEELGLELVDLTKVEAETLQDMPLKLLLRRNLMPLRRDKRSRGVGGTKDGDVPPSGEENVDLAHREGAARWLGQGTSE